LIAGLIMGLRHLSKGSTSWAAVVSYGGGTLLWWSELLGIHHGFLHQEK
jgi:hypothetical protein